MSGGAREALGALSERLVEAGPALRALGLGRRAEAIACVAEQLRAHARAAAAGRDDPALELVAASAGLSLPMAAWALETTAARYEAPALASLAEVALSRPGAVAVPPTLVAVVLAGNVFTAALRAIALPLLVGAPVLAKASSRDPAFADLLARTLDAVAPDVAPALGVVAHPSGRRDLDVALLSRADVVSVYGGQAAVESVRALAAGGTRVVAHGHGLGVALLLPGALEGDGRALARALARDVVAYDGRGCLSPHAVLVPRDGEATPDELAVLLAAHGLAPLGRELPRGPMPETARAAQMQWRSVAVARGRLHEGDDFAVSVEPTLRLSPGYRNVALVPYDAPEEALASLAPYAPFLKVLGVAGPPGTSLAPLARALPARAAPRLVRVGTMQDPPLDVLDDGLPPLEGLVRYVELRP